MCFVLLHIKYFSVRNLGSFWFVRFAWWLYQAFFLCTSKKTEAKKLSFLKKLRPKNEKKLKTEAKKLRSPEALCNDLSQKNSVYWRPYLVISAQKLRKRKKLKTEPKKLRLPEARASLVLQKSAQKISLNCKYAGVEIQTNWLATEYQLQSCKILGKFS